MVHGYEGIESNLAVLLVCVCATEETTSEGWRICGVKE